jgi:hypothetical protein
MSETEIKNKQHVPSSWEDFPSEQEQLSDWKQNAFTAAVETLQDGHGNPDSVMRMGEAFGRGLFAQRIKEKAPDWTMKEWLQELETDVWGPLGMEFTFTKVSHDVVTTFLNRNPLAHSSKEQSAASLFHFGVMRGLFLSAFPQGELVLSEVKNKNHPEFIFKTIASAKDKLERERVIRALTFLKKEDGD